MIITVDLSNPTPVYLQIVEAVRKAIALGSLLPGDRLPAIRETAVQTRVNRNTVGRAYLELAHQGLVRARQGSGFFVTENGAHVERTVRREALVDQARALALEARLAGASTEELIDVLREAAASLESQESRDFEPQHLQPEEDDESLGHRDVRARPSVR
jgi:GntR family transcriptional regulator